MDAHVQTLPHNLEAERSILGVILVNNAALGVASAMVGARDFYVTGHQQIFDAMLALAARAIAIDFVTVKEVLGDRLEAAGGPGYLASLADGMPVSTHVEYYARIVKEKSRLRQLIFHGNRTVADAYDGSKSAAEIAARPAPDLGVVGGPMARAPIVTFLSDVQAEDVDWLWPGRFARGKYTLLAGEPGLGKTYMLTDCAARISRGSAWPDGAPGVPGTVLYLTAEDGLADTLRPRIDRLGGDPSKIAALEAVREPDGSRSALSLVRDLEMLAAAIRDVRPALVVLDPINAYLGKVDTHRDSEVRAALAPLIDLIEQTRCALVAIGHLSKDAQRAALHRPGGSIAFVAAARLVLALAADPNDPDRRLLAPLKSNICRPSPVLGFRVSDTGLNWEADAVADVDVEMIFRPSQPGDREAQTEAEGVIRELLDAAEWPLSAKDALAAGEAHGIPERTLRRTAVRLGIRVARAGFGSAGRWVWHLPHDIAATAPLEPPTVAPMAAMAPMENHSGIQGVIRGPRGAAPIGATSSGFLSDGGRPFHFDGNPGTRGDLTEEVV